MAAVAARFASPLARTARTWAPGLARDAAAATGTRMASGGHALPSKTDFCVVGGGIIGVAIARELAHRHPGASITLLEKESSVAQHASGRNSGVLHAGFYYSPESFKAKLTRAGNVFLHEYIEEKGLKINKCGKIVVARNEEEVRTQSNHVGLTGLATDAPQHHSAWCGLGWASHPGRSCLVGGGVEAMRHGPECPA